LAVLMSFQKVLNIIELNFIYNARSEAKLST